MKRTLVALLALAAIPFTVHSACDVTVATAHSGGQVTLAANCGAVDLDNITWARNGSTLAGPVDLTTANPKINNTPVHLTVSVPAGTHVYSATANGGAIAAGVRAVVTSAAKDLVVSATPGGAVTSAPAGIIGCISTGGTCSASFAHGSNVVLTASPDAGNVFSNWSGACTGSANTCAVTMNEVRTVAASFSPSPVSGTCGAASNSTPVGSAPTGNLCATGSSSAVSDPTASPYNYTWTCAGLYGGASSGTCSVPKILAGVCGPLNGGSAQSSTPSNAAQLCSVGAPGPVTATTSAPYNFLWTCGGVNGGATSSQCAVAQAPSNGVCGSANGTNTLVTPSGTAACASGSLSGMTTPASAGGTYTWTCAGLAGGSNSGTCSANQTVAAACGGANGVATAVAPTTNLCVAGNTASAVSGTGPFSWTCTGVNPASGPISCSAPLAAGSGTDPGIGTGLWLPPGTTNVFVLDQMIALSGSVQPYNYVPGCLGQPSPASSSSGCAVNYQLSASYNGQTYNVSMAQGNVISIRIMSGATVNTFKNTILQNGVGGNVPVSTTLWLSTVPPGVAGGNSGDVPAGCRVTDSGTPTISTTTVAGFCAIQPNTLYYVNMRAEGACSGSQCRYQLTEGADFVQ